MGVALMSLTDVENRPRTLRSCCTHVAVTGVALLSLFSLPATKWGRPATPELEVFPKKFTLHPGEKIHYNVCPSEAVARYLSGKLSRQEFHCLDAEFSTEDPKILKVTSPTTIKNGRQIAVQGVLEAVGTGRTRLVVRTPNSEQRFNITVSGAAQPPITAVLHDSVKEIRSKEFLFVGHANLDGYDFNAVARPGIDRAVATARKNGMPVVFWVSNEYPDWYTADRHPDYAFVSEGQEHEIHVDAERVTFTGGSFMFCVLRNVQMSLHGMLEHGAQHIEFAFPTDAIWVEDADRPDQGWYPVPPVVLKTLFARRRNDAQKYEQVVRQ